MKKLTVLFLCVCMSMGLRMSALPGAEAFDFAGMMVEQIRIIDEHIRVIM